MEFLQYDIFKDETIDFSKDMIYTDKLKINTQLFTNNYRNININHRKSIEDFFINKKTNYTRVYYGKKYDINEPNSMLKKMLYCFRLNKDINKSIVICIFRLKNGLYAIVTYNVNLIPSPINTYICYTKYYMEVLMYIFKLESELKMDTKHSQVIKYPKCFFKNFNYIYNYFNWHKQVDLIRS
jgi:hypothetical protein